MRASGRLKVSVEQTFPLEQAAQALALDITLVRALGGGVGGTLLELRKTVEDLDLVLELFGGSLGLAQDFGGVMAKQQRMAVLTIACLRVLSGGALRCCAFGGA